MYVFLFKTTELHDCRILRMLHRRPSTAILLSGVDLLSQAMKETADCSRHCSLAPSITSVVNSSYPFLKEFRTHTQRPTRPAMQVSLHPGLRNWGHTRRLRGWAAQWHTASVIRSVTEDSLIKNGPKVTRKVCSKVVDSWIEKSKSLFTN